MNVEKIVTLKQELDFMKEEYNLKETRSYKQ